MTNSGYFRSRPKGRFKREDAGDLGIRAYKDQQDQIINALKENKQTSLNYRDQVERGLEGVGRSEMFNQQVLNDLRNQKYQTRRDAIEVAKKTELKKISDQADIYGQKSQWLQEWAPKFYKNLYTATTKTADVYQQFSADQKFKESIESGQFDKTVNFLNSLDDETRAEVIAGRNRAFSEGDLEGVDYLRDVLNGSNRYLSKLYANQLIERTDALESSLKRYITSNQSKDGPGEWNAQNVLKFYKMRARELVKQFGLTGEGAQKLLNHFDTRGALESAKLADYDKLVSDAKQRTETSSNLVTMIGEVDFASQIQQAVITYRGASYRQAGDKSGAIIGTYDTNTAGAFEALFKDMLSTGKVVDPEALRDKMLDSPVPGCTEADITKCQTWRQKFTTKGGNQPLEERMNDTISLVGKALKSKEANKKEAKDGFNLTQINDQLNGTGLYAPGGEKEDESLLNIDTPEKVELAFTAYRSAKAEGNTKSMEALAHVLHIDVENQDQSHVGKLERLWRASISGDYDEMANVYKQLPVKLQQTTAVQKLYKPAILLAANTSDKAITTEATDLIKQHVGVTGLLNTKVHTTGTDMVKYLKQDFYSAYNKLYFSGDYDRDIEAGISDRLIADAWQLARQDLDNGEGFYETFQDKSQGNMKVFKFLDTRGNSSSDKTVIENAMEASGGNLTDINVLNSISNTDLKYTVIDIQSGADAIRLPRSVHLAYELSNKSMSKTEFVNLLLKTKKFGDVESKDAIQIKGNQNDILEAKIENLWSPEGPTTVINDRDVIQRNIYADIVNQTGQIPMKDAFRYPLTDLLQTKYPEFEGFSIDWNGYVNIPFGVPIDEIYRQRVDLGLKLEYTADGGIVFRSRIPAHLQPGAVPSERTPSINIGDTSVEPEYFLQEQVEDK